jgi:SSS family transporter
MTTLHPVDLAIILAYIVAMTLFGLAFTRKQKDLGAYFVGGRNVGWFMVLMSIVATETSAVTFLSVPGLAFDRGGPGKPGGNLMFLQLCLGYIVGRCLVAWLLLPQYMGGNLFSAYEVLRNKFNPRVQRVASGLFLVTRTIADGLRIYLTALLLAIVGWGVGPSILVVGVVTIVYTYLGGMKAVIWTDLIQFAIKISGAALAAVFVLNLLPGGWDQFVRIGREAGKFECLNTAFDPAVTFNIWAGVLGGAVFSMASHGADQLMVQRYLCAGSLRNARLALVLSGFTILLQFALFLLVGVGMFALNREGLFDLPDGALNDQAFSWFIVTKLPVGVVGILVAAVLAAAMSTLSSSLNSSANSFLTDFYRPLRPGKPEGHYVRTSRLATAMWGCAQMAVAAAAFLVGGKTSIVLQVLGVAGAAFGLVLGLFLLGTMKRPVSSNAALVGLLFGAFAVVAVWLPTAFGTPILAWPWYAPVGAGTTVVVALLISRFQPKPFHGSLPTPADGSP